jgi:hypothetical protein
MADFYALILDADYEASKPLIPLHVPTRSNPDFADVTSVDPYQNFGTLNREMLNFERISSQSVLNNYSDEEEGAAIYGVTHL